MPGSSGGTRAQRAASTRAKLLRAAKEVFEDIGYQSARVADVVARAGVAHGSFYHYFDSKEDVFRELAVLTDAQLYAPMQQVILDRNSDAPPARRIRTSLRRFLEAYRREAKMIGVVEQVSRFDDYLGESRRKRLAVGNEELANSIRWLQEHDLADKTLDPALTAMILGSVTTRFPEAWLVEGVIDCTLDDAVEQIARVYIKTLGLSEELSEE